MTGSLRSRLVRWSVLVLTPAIVLLTAASIWEVRREVIRQEREYARALLEHLAHMDEFRGTLLEATSRVEAIRDLLRATGAGIEIVPRLDEGAPKGRRLVDGLADDALATQPLALRDGDFALRYRADSLRVRKIALRSAATHALYGVVAVAALVAGMQWILSRKLFVPLSRIAHKVDNMRAGGGWLPVLPSTDSELAELARSVRELGPGLESQVREWIEVERRVATATVLNDLGRSLRAPRRRMMALAGDLQARGWVTPKGKAELRALNDEIDRVVAILRIEETSLFSQGSPVSGSSPSGNAR